MSNFLILWDLKQKFRGLKIAGNSACYVYECVLVRMEECRVVLNGRANARHCHCWVAHRAWAHFLEMRRWV